MSQFDSTTPPVLPQVKATIFIFIYLDIPIVGCPASQSSCPVYSLEFDLN